MLFVVALLLVTSSYALDFTIESVNRGILTKEVKQAFKELNKKYNDKMNWDKELAKEALKEAEQRWSSEQPLIIYRKRKFESSLKAEEMVKKTLEDLFKKYGMWLRYLPAKTRYGCNGVVNYGTEITAVITTIKTHLLTLMKKNIKEWRNWKLSEVGLHIGEEGKGTEEEINREMEAATDVLIKMKEMIGQLSDEEIELNQELEDRKTVKQENEDY
ncbi:hypothetical protein GCK32_006244 [Trichostrongylus colubriformis]|uniref:Uncharacterized protein n=1 Tax=Trichostrongylus colubriformis TaxID=6319 RepID=A0AAN8IS34_TRICO